MLPQLNGYLDGIRPHVRNVGHVMAAYACDSLALLRQIADNTGSRTKTRRYVDPLNFAGGDTKTREVQVGQIHRLTLLAVSAATTITIRSGGRLVYVKAFAGADTIGPDAQITAGPGSSYDITSLNAAEVTLHLAITQRDDPRPGVSGERLPVGIHTNHMDLALAQHFPDLLPNPDASVAHPAGTIHGAGD